MSQRYLALFRYNKIIVRPRRNHNVIFFYWTLTVWHVSKNYIEGTLIMGAFNEIITTAIEIMTLPVLILLFAVLLYIYGSFWLLTWCLKSNQRLNSTSYRRGKIPDIKTSRSKSKKSTSVAVQLKDTIVKDTGTAQLQVHYYLICIRDQKFKFSIFFKIIGW